MEQKPVKKVVIEEKDFAEIVKFCMSVSVGFDKIEDAAKMKEALKGAKLMELKIEDNVVTD